MNYREESENVILPTNLTNLNSYCAAKAKAREEEEKVKIRLYFRTDIMMMQFIDLKPSIH